MRKWGSEEMRLLQTFVGGKLRDPVFKLNVSPHHSLTFAFSQFRTFSISSFHIPTLHSAIGSQGFVYCKFTFGHK